MAVSSSSNKRHKLSDSDSIHDEHDNDPDEEEEQVLLPGLPDHLSQVCLWRVPPPVLFSACRPWRRLLYSPSFPRPFLAIYALLLSDQQQQQQQQQQEIHFASFDPVSAAWTPLPPPPEHRSLLLRHPSFISRHLPVQTASVAGKLVLLAATDRRLLPALPRPLLFDPSTGLWLPGPKLPSPRRWCAAGSAGSRLYVASGFGSRYSSATARSAWAWDADGRRGGGEWKAVASLKDPRFSREPAEMVRSGKQRLCVVDRKTKQGAVYNMDSDRWEEMPPGLLSGWTGPAASAASEEDAVVYAVDEGSGEMRRYEREGDTWTVVTASSEGMRGATSVAAGGGRVCVAGGGGRRVTVVDVAADAKAVRTWDLLPPDGKRVMAMHVLPRMARGSVF